MKYQFGSSFASRIGDMLGQRALLGYSIDDYQNRLANFDRFCVAHFPNVDVLTQEIAFAWCSDALGNGSGARACAIRGFGRYLVRTGEEAYILPPLFFPNKKLGTRCIPSDAELSRFFEATDQLPASKPSPMLEYTIPVIFRLQYACGLRPQEVRLLRRAEVNFHASSIYIANGKHYKDRRLPVSAQVMEMCRKYDKIIDAVTPNREYFFQSSTGRAYSNEWLSGCFRRCWAMGNGDSGGSCTAYSLRHRYATDTLAQWMEEGKDLDAWLPYLSAYMGHGSFSATYSYVHLMPGRLARLEAMRIIGIIPEVADGEKDA